MKKGDFYSETEEGLIIRVHCQPRAKKTGFAGYFGDAIKLRLNAPPADGKANKEAKNFLAGFFNVPKRDVILRSGERSREKSFLIKGVAPKLLKKLSCL